MVTLLVRDTQWSAAEPSIERRIREALAVALPGDGRPISVVLADDQFVHGLNARFRGKDKPTNVLSFPAPARASELGDIVLAFETVAREAKHEHKTLAQHTAHLVIHGALHLLGHDHEADTDAERMRAAEVVALGRLGLPNPYADTEDEELQ